jgi:hypothetical protein
VVDAHRGRRAAVRVLPAAALLHLARAPALTHPSTSRATGHTQHAGHPQEKTSLDRLVRHRRQKRLHASQLDEEPGHSRPTLSTAGRSIGICNTWSELTPCNAHSPQALADHVKRGVYEAGGLPLEFPVMSATASRNMRPTAMLFRNLASMDVEEAIRGNPDRRASSFWSAVTRPRPPCLMGAASAATCLPSPCPADRCSTASSDGKDIGSGTAVSGNSHEEVKAGEHRRVADFFAAEQGQHVAIGGQLHDDGYSFYNGQHGGGAGHLGMPDNAAIPAVDSRRWRARPAGRACADRRDWSEKDVTMCADPYASEAFENAIRVNARDRRLDQRGDCTSSRSPTGIGVDLEPRRLGRGLAAARSDDGRSACRQADS